MNSHCRLFKFGDNKIHCRFIQIEVYPILMSDIIIFQRSRYIYLFIYIIKYII